MANRPDFSYFIAHFTTDRAPLSNHDDNPANEFAGKSAKDKLINILAEKKIHASKMPWTGCLAVCFTECPWSSLLDHATRYSSYGIGFNKSFVFAKGGGPVYYVRPKEFSRQGWQKAVLPFVTPFLPSYAPKSVKDSASIGVCDFTHEREWRVPHDFSFDYKDVKFIILKDYNDMATFPKEYKDAIGREKFFLIDDYKKIETFWPVHRL